MDFFLSWVSNIGSQDNARDDKVEDIDISEFSDDGCDGGIVISGDDNVDNVAVSADAATDDDYDYDYDDHIV